MFESNDQMKGIISGGSIRTQSINDADFSNGASETLNSISPFQPRAKKEEPKEDIAVKIKNQLYRPKLNFLYTSSQYVSKSNLK